MILSSPFSRQNRSHQSWTPNGSPSSQQTSQSQANQTSSLRKPAPLHAAPQQPKSNGYSQPAQNQFRSSTLNRLDVLKARKSQQEAAQLRNSSALGHRANNGTNYYNSRREQIYSPASIASPREFNSIYKQPNAHNNNNNNFSQHYAATSCHNNPTIDYLCPPPRSESRSGRESALGNLFGTLRRKAKWRTTSSKSQKSSSNSIITPTPSSNGTLLAQPLTSQANNSSSPDFDASGKRQVLAEDIYAEGLRAIDGNCEKRLLQHQIDESLMSEGEIRTLIDENSMKQQNYLNLVETLTNWINDELSQQRIIVKDLQDDLHDGQILAKLIEHLHQIKLDIVEVTQNELSQKYKLRTVLDIINRILSLQARWARIRWTVEGIHGKNMVEIIHLLVTLARYYKAPIKFEPNVRVNVLVVEKYRNELVKRVHQVLLTDATEASSLNSDANNNQLRKADVFDTLVEFAPEKLTVVKQSLVKFVNRHLNKINVSCTSQRNEDILEPEQFNDGLLFVFLISSLEDYFVPLGNLFTAPPAHYSSSNKQEAESTLPGNSILQTALEPTSFINTQPIHKLHNVNFALQLMEEAGISIRDRVRAEDIVNGDLKSVMRVLYALFSRYKHL